MKLQNICGLKFGRLKVISQTGTECFCKCSCGNTRWVDFYKLTSGHTKSCGCLKIDTLVGNVKKHGGRKTRLYGIWVKMRSRCSNPMDGAFCDYGGRGISVCEKWAKSFSEFREWAYHSGYTENLTIDRIDVNGNYEPDNCRWATRKEQSRNRRNNRWLEVNGETYLLEDWAKIVGIDKRTILQRLKRGWSVEKSIMTEVRT